MLLELARQLIARAREDVTYPIPMVFNLTSWTEKLTLADWLAQELNNLYSVPRKTTPDWVKGNKLLLLLDGLDEVRQESRAKCVEAINAFRKEHGLTSLAVCSRSQDYADLNTKLSFEGAIEIQPLTQKQITEFFNRFGKEMAGIKQVLKKDSALREMAETPLFLSIMIMAYRDKRDVDILVSQDEKSQRKHLFDNYIERMFERPRSKNAPFCKSDAIYWLSWLACSMSNHSQMEYMLENLQVSWFEDEKQIQQYEYVSSIIYALFGGIFTGGICGLLFGLKGGLTGGLIGFFLVMYEIRFRAKEMLYKDVSTVDIIYWNWSNVKLILYEFIRWYISGVKRELFLSNEQEDASIEILQTVLSVQKINQTTYPGQRLALTTKNFLTISTLFGMSIGLIGGLFFELVSRLIGEVRLRLIGELKLGWSLGLFLGISIGVWSAFFPYGGFSLIQHYILRFVLINNNRLPKKLIPFLDHCVDLIFLRRVGGGYIFVHRLLMEHFAEMYVETPTSKGN
jgi:hypothetical protein